MDVSKRVSLLATHPSFDMGFDRAVNGANYLFGESVSLINFIKVRIAFAIAFVYVFPSLFLLVNVSFLTAQSSAFVSRAYLQSAFQFISKLNSGHSKNFRVSLLKPA